MPILTLNTNLPKSKFTQDFLLKTSEVMAKTLQREESVSYIISIVEQTSKTNYYFTIK